MPKLIENLRENIISYAKQELLDHGYAALTIRGVASACGIAAGTVYNYFSSKDVMAAAIMLDDWLCALAQMRESCHKAQSVREALTALHNGVAEYRLIYGGVWSDCGFTGTVRAKFPDRHRMLVNQLAECMMPVLTGFVPNFRKGTELFLAENILICDGNSDLSFDVFLDIVDDIINKE